MQKRVHVTSVRHGWWADEEAGSTKSIPEKLMLIVSEVSEALEEYRMKDKLPDGFHFLGQRYQKGKTGLVFEFRKGGSGKPMKPLGFRSELADIVIRVMDLAERHGIDLQKDIEEKMLFNETRPYRHGGKAC
jgi:NTP pyrophosphatase (non-canonical NTP hydrolase)